MPVFLAAFANWLIKSTVDVPVAALEVAVAWKYLDSVAADILLKKASDSKLVVGLE